MKKLNKNDWIQVLRLCRKLLDSKKFSGLGFVVTTKKVLRKYSLPLRPSTEKTVIERLNQNINNLSSLSKALLFLAFSKRYHDGFQVLDRDGKFIGISRLLFIKKSKLKPNEERGTRYYVAKIFSLYEGVDFVGIIESDECMYYFIKGKEYKVEEAMPFSPQVNNKSNCCQSKSLVF